MYKINSLGNEPKQKLTVMINDRERVVLTFEYKANQIGWFFGFEYGDINYQNIRLTTAYNILRAYRNWLPFGVRCDTQDGLEPMDLEDFVTGYAAVYILTSDDVINTETTYYTKIYEYPEA